MTTADGPTPQPRSRWPLGLLGTLALVVGVEGYIATRNVDLGTMYTIEWRLMSKAVKKQAPRAEILCFGTSLSSIAVSPLILEERTGHSVFNLSLSGAQPYASYLMLRHALEAGAHPRAIVVDFKWTSVRNKPTELERILPEIATLGECLRYALDQRDGSFLGRIALVKELPSYACRVEIRANVAAAIRGEEPTRNHQWLTGARNMRVNKGRTTRPRFRIRVTSTSPTSGSSRPSGRATRRTRPISTSSSTSRTPGESLSSCSSRPSRPRPRAGSTSRGRRTGTRGFSTA